jgi:Ser/Thr protein kinase RdoA (MazF antagonist)
LNKRQEIEVQWGLTHTDYHPLNLLMKNEKVVCVLDFEDLQRYPLIAALGFGGYKLIRQMMVDPAIRERDRLQPTLLRRWLRGWEKSFPDVSLKAETLNLSTKYRVLSLIHTIFYTYLRLNDDSFNYDLAKQIGSLYEIDTIMTC